MFLKNILGLLMVSLIVSNVIASPNAENLKISKMFSSNMILQRDIKVPVWGWAEPGGTVKVEFNGQSIETIVGKDGKWMVKLKPMKSGGPFTMTVSGQKNIKFKNVMLGDVWLCGGQSNMAWRVRSSINSRQEMANAKYPQIRFFTCPISTNQTPQEKLSRYTGCWKVCTPKTVGNFSGVGYFFGRDLFKKINIPVGLISSNVGGTAIELWTPRKDLGKNPAAQAEIRKFERQCADPKMQEKLKLYLEAKNKVTKYRKKIRKYGSKEWTADSGGKWEKINTAAPTEKAKRDYALLSIRKEVKIPEEWKGKDLIIYIYYPMVYGYSKVFFNGHPARRLNKWLGHHYKSFMVKDKYIKSGKAVIGEYLFSYQYGKYFQEGRGRSYITAVGSNKKIELSGIWEMKLLDRFKPQREPMHAKHRKAINGLYNAMINPIMPFAIKGVIWYQGEANARKAYNYRKLLPLMIESWRKNWQQGNFPFLIVQLANYGKPDVKPKNSDWAELREAQAMTAKKLINCGIATAIDIGEEKNIHPTNKQDVGARLALVARKLVYGEDIVYSGPVYQSMKIKGNRIILKFKNIGGGLLAKGGKLKYFSIAGSNKKFLWADAVIDGDTVIVSSKKVVKPVAVRYAWAKNPAGANLYNKEGLPAFPFRTDDWTCSTK